MLWSLLAWSPVAGTVAIVAWSYYAFIVTAVSQLKGLFQAEVAIVYHLVLILWIMSYYKVIATLPGSPQGVRMKSNDPVDDADTDSAKHLLINNEASDSITIIDLMQTTTPSAFELHHKQQQQLPSFVTLETKSDGKPRFCKKCDAWKPDRSHHCSQCGVCVLRMDHHCVFINCCVGWKNHKFFFLFLLYTSIYCLGICAFLIQHLIRAFKARSVEEMAMQLNIHWVLLIFVSGAFGVVLLAFGALHLMYILTNKTTIESMERARRYRVFANDSPSSRAEGRDGTALSRFGVNIFDVGAKENWKAVMGRDWRYWFLPVDSSDGDGHTFPVNYDTLEKLRKLERDMDV
ncbi:DHHC palmitoyltransferase-domain-containing protein [Obelidium mucronatum]|nr:DHHC palmitoyltransferase-domain-containing protein [Obelidium mucronatum]